MRRRASALAVVAWLACARAAVAHDAVPLPPLDFDPPAPGTYTLHRVMTAPDGEALGIDGRAQRLSRFTRGHITLLGFIYTTCVDPDGCPLAYRVFDAVKQALATAPALRHYAGSRVSEAGHGLRWYFLTTRSARELRPLVDGFGQDIRSTIDRSNGQPRRELSHVLKVFLIDPASFVREIYTSTFLHPRTVLNDIETLRMETNVRGASATPAR